MVFNFTFKSLLHLELIFLSEIGGGKLISFYSPIDKLWSTDQPLLCL